MENTNHPDLGEQVIVRTYSAGVHFGKLVNVKDTKNGMYVTLQKTRRIRSWAGAHTLSELATLGSSKPSECEFTMPVIQNSMTAIEVIRMTDEAVEQFSTIPYWKISSKSAESIDAIIQKMEDQIREREAQTAINL